MLIIALIAATSLITIWLILLYRTNHDDWAVAAYNKVFQNLMEIDKLRLKQTATQENRFATGWIPPVLIKLMHRSDAGRKADKIQRRNERLKAGDLSTVSVFAIPGYVLQREFSAIGKGEIHKRIMAKNYELYGKKHAVNLTKHLLAKLLSYPVIGVALTLMLGVMFTGAGSTTTGTAILGIGIVIVLVLTYAMYDELGDKVKKRRNSIGRQFPNVASKLALLVTSGMIVDRAWKETAYSQSTQLYKEMRKTSDELDNLVSPESAYSDFINRCNTKETAKLASAILQNQSKGNAEIGRLLKDLAREAWQERRHTAKRDAEKTNSKLMIPTMMLFIAILVMLMVPVAMNFSGI